MILINKNILNYFKKNNLNISNIKPEKESQQYNATKFQLENTKTKQIKDIIFRTGKSTPTKQGHFVTFWKRDENKITIPFDTKDKFDYLIIYVKNKEIEGLFIFTKQILLENKIITNYSNNTIKGKNGFRLYTPELNNLNKQATKSQIWQSKMFSELNNKGKLLKLIN
mgnify:CR=1 FL=1